jgi:hypothetical protein
MRLLVEHAVHRVAVVALSTLVAIAVGMCGPASSDPQEVGETSWADVTLLRAEFPKRGQGAIVSTQRVRVYVEDAPTLSPEGLTKWAIADRLWDRATSDPVLLRGGDFKDRESELDQSLNPEHYRIAVDGDLRAKLRLTVGVFGRESEADIDEIRIAPPQESTDALALREEGVEPEEGTELYRLYKTITVAPAHRPDPKDISWTKIDARRVDQLAAFLKYEGSVVPDHIDLVLPRGAYPDRVYTLSLGQQTLVFGGQRTGLEALSETFQLRVSGKEGGEWKVLLTDAPTEGSCWGYDFYRNFTAEAHIDSADDAENRNWVKATYDYTFVKDGARRQIGLRFGTESDSNFSEVRPMVDGYLARLLAPGAIAFLTGQGGWDDTEEEWIGRYLLSAEYVGLAGPGTLRIRAMLGRDRQAGSIDFESLEWWTPFDAKWDFHIEFRNGRDLPDFERVDRRVKIGLRHNS